MAKYAIGDIQGCYKQFIELIKKINFSPSTDTLYLVGDLVNRGPQSLEVLDWAYRHQDSIQMVLGNHDIYLLGRYNNILPVNHDDTLNELLLYTNANKIIDWLRIQPLIYQDDKYILVHAGIYPQLKLTTSIELAEEIQANLSGADYPKFIDKIYGNKPQQWNNKLPQIERMRFIVNTCTRMRYLNRDTYALEFKYKGELAAKPPQLVPWFQVDFDPSITKKIVFGHWAALGFYHDPKFISLDTGCVWGRRLTAINLDNFEIYQVIH
jgi:bis(5'-nucleosyl)-tetraphosphatase (symmetrical)